MLMRVVYTVLTVWLLDTTRFGRFPESILSFSSHGLKTSSQVNCPILELVYVFVCVLALAISWHPVRRDSV